MPVLKLNKSWFPIEVTTVREAISLIFDRRAYVIETDGFQSHDFESWAQLTAIKGQPALHTATLEIRVPEVIVLTNYDKAPDKHVVFSRANIYRRDRYTCQYCGMQPGTRELTIDHVIPKSRGGTSSWDNCILACVPCNAKKANLTPTEAGMRLRKDPCKPEWSLRMTLGKIRNVPVSWSRFVSDAYWNTELK